MAIAVGEADELALRTTATRYGVQPVLVRLSGGDGVDPIDDLLTQVDHRAADAVMVPNRRYLTDRHGRDSLDKIRQRCAVVTVAPAQLWPCTAHTTPLTRRSAS
ncbi:hypothetical protein [Nocardia vaccinii]|uniref:hypothetical protein n=1 Tax=Nocardia vaccinii TaxID=1822 RepID=UPI0008330ABA|nr:hypothetical protein [Nocardia vaccinii]